MERNVEVITSTEALRRYGVDNVIDLQVFMNEWNERCNAGNCPVIVNSIGGGLFELIS